MKIQVIRSLFLISLTLASTSAEVLFYKARVLLAMKATLKITVKNTNISGVPHKLVTSKSKVFAFGKQLINLDYHALTKSDLSPLRNIECDLDKNNRNTDVSKKNCRAVEFIGNNEFLYKKLHLNTTSLQVLSPQDESVTFYNILDQQADFDNRLDKVYDLSSLILSLRNLQLSAANPSKIYYIGINKEIVKVKVSFVKKINSYQNWIKLTPISPTRDEIGGPFPHKIIYNTKLKVIEEIHQKIPIAGNVKVKLDKKRSSF